MKKWRINGAMLIHRISTFTRILGRKKLRVSRWSCKRWKNHLWGRAKKKFTQNQKKKDLRKRYPKRLNLRANSKLWEINLKILWFRDFYPQKTLIFLCLIALKIKLNESVAFDPPQSQKKLHFSPLRHDDSNLTVPSERSN